jgi:hypothetical protein
LIYLLVVIMIPSELIILAPCRKNVPAPQLAQLFIDNVFLFKRFGMPTSIVVVFCCLLLLCLLLFLTEIRGSLVTSGVVHILARTELAMSTAYHPPTDEKTERANMTIEDMPRGLVGPR